MRRLFGLFALILTDLLCRKYSAYDLFVFLERKLINSFVTFIYGKKSPFFRMKEQICFAYFLALMLTDLQFLKIKNLEQICFAYNANNI